ncbi:hypothetical protein [Modestobacter marinus]|uniref:hypothetical protein n=1 Tax=Modestobacter marinus TaxID=477641 RepID=UPI001C95F66F|nr:hypothetical protein [Modestobacter marinus]
MLELYAIADGHRQVGPGDPAVVICMDEFGPLNLQPHPASSGPRSPPARASPTPRGGAAGGPPTPGRMACGT